MKAQASQAAFGFRAPSASLLRPGEIVLDFFAGGGGASEALRQALGRDPDVAVNHDVDAIGMHAANHPCTRHLREDVWTVDILREVAGRPVGWFHASPDCTHFSQAKGGQPRSRATRSLSWVVIKVAGTLVRAGLAPRIISLENVRQILQWGPLVAKRDKATGRVLKLDGTVAAPGERVSIDQQFLIPDKRRAGQTWRSFVHALRTLGYTVEWRRLKACDYGAGTSRERLFLIARRDGQPIQWPEPTHGPGRAQPYITAADCIDWSIPCPSIFERKRPLAEATCRRIARGIKRYVLDAAEPFIVGACHAATRDSADLSERVAGERLDRRNTARAETVRGAGLHHDAARARPVSCSVRDGERSVQAVGRVFLAAHAVSAPHLTQFANASNGLTWYVDEPLRTQCAGVKGGHFAAVCAFLEQANGGFAADGAGHDARAPMSTITGAGSQQRLVGAALAKLRGTSSAADPDDPLATISAGGQHHAVVECTLSREQEAGALRVAAFLIRYYSEGGQWGDLRAPFDTITTKDRLALVTVTLHGTPYVIVDIGLRMLRPLELYRAQGFPPSYVINRTADGRPLTGTAQVRMVGNSVSPPLLAALARANLDRVSMRIAA